MRIIPVEQIQSIAELFYLTNEKRLNTDAFLTLFLLDPLASAASGVVDLAETLDDLIDKHTQGAFFQIIESLNKPSPELYFNTLKLLALETTKAGGENITDPQDNHTTHYSYLSKDGKTLIRMSLADAPEYKHFSIQLGTPNPNKPTLNEQYNPDTRITDNMYYENGVRTKYEMSFDTSTHGRGILPPYNTILEKREFMPGIQTEVDYNGKLTPYTPAEIGEWFNDLKSMLPNEIKSD